MFIIQEIQTENNVTTLLPAIQKESKLEADSAYYSIMAAAAISDVDVHTCIVYDEHGNDVTPGKKYYEHIEQPIPPAQE